MNDFLLKIFLAVKSDGLVLPEQKVALFKNIFACLVTLKGDGSAVEDSVVKNFLEFVIQTGFKTEFAMNDDTIKFICRHQGESESISSVIKENAAKILTPS